MLGLVAPQLCVQLALRVFEAVAWHEDTHTLMSAQLQANTSSWSSKAQSMHRTLVNDDVLPCDAAETRTIQLAHEVFVGGQHSIKARLPAHYLSRCMLSLLAFRLSRRWCMQNEANHLNFIC